MQCKNCGNEVNDGENFCRECGTGANEVYRGNTIETKKKIKNPFIIGIILLIVFIFAMSMVKVLFNFHESITLEDGANNTVEIPTKNEFFKIDNNSETGALYNFTLQDVKKALDLVCKEKNRSNYTDFVYTDSNSYNKVYEAYGDTANKDLSVINVQTYNNYVTMITYQYSNVGAGYAELQGKEIFFGLINKLFNDEYSSKIITILKELPNNKYKYYDRTLCSVINATNLNINQITINSCSQKYFEQSKSAYPNLFE